ncbi:hypothetical protein [Bacteroides graminisolvens]
MLDIQHIVDSWTKDELIYKKIGKCTSDFIRAQISEYEILPEISFRTKELLSIIKKIKKKQLSKEYSYENLNDKLGVRIICSFESELNIVDHFLKEFFNIVKVEYKKDELIFDKLDYQSNHYDVTIKSELNPFASIKDYKDFVFEIQVRTLNQHAWSNAAHGLSYKQDKELPDEIKRRIYRLLALYELADQEIEFVNSYLKNQNTDLSYSILQKLEGKIYKYAKVDYDKEYSIDVLRIFSSIFQNDKMHQINENIDTFVSNYHEKIKRIFDENRFRFYEISFLTQPEIFVSWYALENFEYTLTDSWDNYFDSEDLEQIRTLWGKVIE